MNVLKRVFKFLVDIIEVWVPATVFVAMFLVFLVNVFFRYVMKNPQNWTYEFSINAFVIVGLMGACTAARAEDHVVFDLLYSNLQPKSQNILRIISYAVIIILFSISLPATVKYIFKLPNVTSIMKIPQKIIFSSYPILLVSMIIRSAHRMVLDIIALKRKTYAQTYNTDKKEVLI